MNHTIPTSLYVPIPPGTGPEETTPAKTAHSARTATMFVVLTAVFMSLLDVMIVSVAFPAIARHFGEANVAKLSWVLNGYAIVFAALLVPSGRWADRVGRKRLFLSGLALFTGASALCAAAGSVWILVGSRILQAAGAALLSPAAMGLFLSEFPPEKRSIAVALFAAVGATAAGAGAPVGGLLTQISWHWVFLVNLPVGIAALVAGTRVLREIRESSSGPRPDIFGALLFASGIGFLITEIVKGRDWNWNRGLMGGYALIALALLILFVDRSRRHPAPVIEFPILRVRFFAVSNLAALLIAIAFGSMLLSNVMFLTHVWQSASWLLGLQLAPGPLTAAAVALPAGKLCGRFGQRVVGVAGAVSFAAGSAWWIWHLGPTPHFITQFLPGSILVGVGVGLSLPSVWGAAIASLPPSRLSTGSGILNMSRQIGLALGVAILVAIIGNADGPNNLAQFRYGYLAMALAALASGVTCLALKRGDLASSKEEPA
jgi:EmrB/QacA subfamily drug resistance transporter